MTHLFAFRNLSFGITHSLQSIHCFVLSCAPTGRAGKGDQSVMNDGAFDGYLKRVEGMHAQGKSSFETEFNVSQVGVGLLHIPTDMGRFISLFCTLSLTHSHAHAHTHTFTHMRSLLTRRQPHPLQLQLMSSTMQRTGTRTSSLVSGLDRLGMHTGEGAVRVSMCQRYHMHVIHTVVYILY